MVLVLAQIRSRAKILKPWLGIQVSNSKTIQELYNDFAAGALDSTSEIPNDYNSAQVSPSMGKSKTDDKVPVDSTTTLGEATSIVGHYIDFNVEKLDEPESSSSENQRPTAFDMLLQAARDKTHLPDRYPELNKKDKLKNDLICWLETNKVGWSADEKSFLGKQFINTVCTVMWEIDGNHKTLSDRGCSVPQALSKFTGYNLPELRKKRKATADSLNISTLSANASSLLHLTTQAYMKCAEWRGVRQCILTLATNIRKYCEYLKAQQESSSKNKARTTIVQSEREVWKTYEETTDMNHSQKQSYGLLHDALVSAEFFDVVCLNEFTPSLPWKKYEYLKALVVPCKAVRYTYTGGMANLDFIWRVPTSYDDASLLSNNIKIRDKLSPQLPMYHTRAMKRTFVQAFGTVMNCKPAFLRKAYQFVTGDASAATNLSEEETDKRVTEMLELQDPELVIDLRINNKGQPEKYSIFLEECKKYIEAAVETAVDERRHDQVADGDAVVHLAAALSLRDLHEQVKKRCDENTPIPSRDWLRLQFWPRRINSSTCSRYYGTIKVKYMVQARQFRHQHIDMHYASALFRYLKEFCIKYRDDATMVCMDDKHSMKIGEPGYPVAAVERGKQVIVAKGTKLAVGDHDFTKMLLTPSVILKVEIPPKIEESFYKGQVFVGLKDHTFEPSSSLRHLTELHSILKEDSNPLLALYTDGGPDHRTNFISVQLSIISLFLKEDRDMVVAVRTPPYNSWKDPAERVMSTLNIGAQAVGLMRTETGIEDLLKGCSSLKSIRELAEKNPALNIREQVLNSTKSCKELLSSIFERLEYSKKPISTFQAASEEDIKSLWDEIMKIDPSISQSDTSMAAIEKRENFMEFYKSHCQRRHYFFSVKKCSDVNCTFHLPPRMDDFENLHHLPDPVPKGEHYESFEAMYGKETSEKYRPSLNEKAKKDKQIRFNPTKQTALCVSQTIVCEECGKPRLLHAAKKVVDREALHRLLEGVSYSCGSTLQSIIGEEEIVSAVYVRADITCSSTIELPYYSANYPDVCIQCGSSLNLDVNAEFYPMCADCKAKGVKSTKRRTRVFKPKN